MQNNNHIIIYRNQLFKPSETFITEQTKLLKNYQTIFVGRKLAGSPPRRLSIQTLSTKKDILKHALFRDNKTFYNLVHQYHPKLIHAHFGVEGVYALPLAKKLNIPLITTFHGFDATSNSSALLMSGKVSWVNYYIFRSQLAKQGNLFLGVSNFICEKLIKLGFPSNKIATHYTGIDIVQFQPASNLKKDKIILHVARLVEVKGTRYLLEAFALLRKKNSEAQLVIIGDGPLTKALIDYTVSLKIAPWVTFMGMIPHHEVIQWMQKSTVFCLPGIKTRDGNEEALGMVFLEASAVKLPVVATNHGGIPEAVLNEKTGYLVAEKNPGQLADRLYYLLENQGICKSLGEAGRQHVETNFDLKKQTERLESIYQST